MRILVDTNILLRIAQPGSPHHHDALAALDVLDQAGHELCLVPQVVYEYWVSATRPVSVNGLEMSAEETRMSLNVLLPYYTFLDDIVGVFAEWLDLVTKHAVHGKVAHDARYVAAMKLHGVTHLLTYNVSDFSRYPHIVALSPKDILAGRMP